MLFFISLTPGGRKQMSRSNRSLYATSSSARLTRPTRLPTARGSRSIRSHSLLYNQCSFSYGFVLSHAFTPPLHRVLRFVTLQDGSCNVLQHYAAMGRDQKGAEAVNLCPLDVPQDVYSDVVKMVSGRTCIFIY